MKSVKISLNSIDKVKSFVNDIAKFDAGLMRSPSWAFSVWIFHSQST